MTLQTRLKRLMKRNDWRVADLSRHLGRPYTTVREWAVNGRQPEGTDRELKRLEQRLATME